MGRSKRGTVGIETTPNNKLRLRLPRTIAEVNARYISTGLDDTPENRRRVQRTAWEIEEDIQHNRLDPTLSRYAFNKVSSNVVVTKATKDVPTLTELWQAYCEHRKPLVSITTYRQKYCSYFANHINKLPSHRLSDAEDIRQYLINNLSNDAAKRVLTHINACCKWALAAGLIPHNPFVGMADGLRRSWNSEAIDPFSIDERNAILDAYLQHPKYSHYHSLVRFLFLTGCRPGEATALRWANVHRDYVLFCESYSGRYRLVKDTKTHKPRRFPCNEQLRKLLESIKPTNTYDPNGLVFVTHHHNQQINSDALPTAVGWKLILTGLVDEGKVQRYRTPYHTRHSFITLALQHGLTVPQVAKLVGNTPKVILQHYAGNTVLDVPVF